MTKRQPTLMDRLKSDYRPMHHKEPLNEEDYEWLVTELERSAPDATRKEIEDAIESVFKIQELKLYKFYNCTYIEAHSMDEAKEKFANNSENFAADADCKEADEEEMWNQYSVTS